MTPNGLTNKELAVPVAAHIAIQAMPRTVLQE